MALDGKADLPVYTAPAKDLYAVGEMPPLGHVPAKMHAWTIRRERHGEPDKAFEIEVVPTPTLDSHEVLVFVMAAGVNYNGVWAALGLPISPFDVHGQDYHIAGSDASGIVWAVDGGVKIGLVVLFLAGAGLVLWATFMISHWRLFGLQQAWQAFTGVKGADDEFSTPALYKYSSSLFRGECAVHGFVAPYAVLDGHGCLYLHQ